MATNPVSEILEHLRRTELLREGEKQTDRQLLESFVRRRDGMALEALVRRHGPMVWGVCRRVLANHHDAEDAFQATFLVLVRKAASIRSRELLANWLYGVAHQTARKARQTAAKRQARERQVAEMPEPKLESQDQDLWPDLQPLLDEELSRLPDKYRAVIVLCELEGKSRPEVARQLGLPEGTIGSRLARARAMLAKRLTRRGLAVSGTTLAGLLSRQAAQASVPNTVLSIAVKGATLLASGEAAAGAISTQVSALTEGVLKAMLLRKLKTMVAVVVVVGLALSAGALTRHVLAAPQVETTKGPHPDGAGAANTRQDHPDGKDQVGGAKEGDRAFKLVEGGMVRSAVLSPDGATLVASTVVFPKDGAGKPSSPLTTRLQVVDAVTGKKLRTIDLDGDEAFWLAFTPDGKGVIGATSHYTPRGAGDKNTARLWDITTGKEVRRFTGHPVYVYGIALSRDGKVLASCGGGSYDAHGKELPGDVRLWDVASGKELAQLKGHTMSVSRVAFSPDGVTLASGGHDRTVRLWDTKARKETLKLDHGGSALDPLGAVDGLAFSPDGKHLASIGQGRLVVWDVATGEEVRELKGGRHVAFSPDGALIASGREDKVVYLWETATGKEVATFTGYTSTGGSVSFSTDGKTLITAGADDTVRLWAIPRVKRGSTPQ